MKKRYIIYLSVLILVLLGGLMGGNILVRFTFPASISPVLPVIQLPGEVIMPWPGGKAFLGGLFGGGLTNTFLATLVTFALIILLAVSLKPRSRTADEVPTGFYNFFEMVYEGLYGYVQNAAGKWTKAFFPFFLTFILWILIANWLELIPGVDSIGKWENLPHFEAEVIAEKAEAKGEHMSEEEIEEIEHRLDEENIGDLRSGPWLLRALEDENGEKPAGADWTIVPYLRAPATDLNFTFALALISVIMTQYYGMKAQGMSYWKKFFYWDGNRISKDPLAIMDTGVGLLEFISEIFKIVSFAFRLFGNIFAGQVLLFVIAALLPVANLGVYFLEFGIGALQALVFALLTLTFMAGATESHH
ncbi:MAG: F0F1 ATP synthase subunit A [Chloroflexi bacterium]|nr:F0F1 ATP synthase subunit A [Chloroflexota bacterium]